MILGYTSGLYVVPSITTPALLVFLSTNFVLGDNSGSPYVKQNLYAFLILLSAAGTSVVVPSSFVSLTLLTGSCSNDTGTPFSYHSLSYVLTLMNADSSSNSACFAPLMRYVPPALITPSSAR